MPLNVAVLGAGKMGQRHVDALQRNEDLLLQVVDVVEESARTLAECYSIPWHCEPDSVLADPAIDAVVLCTPVPLHAKQTLEALMYGKHVFCEKPLCLTEERGLAILRAAENSRKVVQTGFLSRYAPGLIEVKRWLEQGLIGRPHLASFRIGGRGSHRKWKHSSADGGGVVSEMLTHKIDQALWFFGPFDRAKTFLHENILPVRTIDGTAVKVDAEDLFVGEARVGSMRMLFQADFVSPSYVEYTEIHGDNGSIFTSILSQLPTTLFLVEPRDGFPAGMTEQRFQPIDLVKCEMRDFLEKIGSGDCRNDSIRDAIHLAQALKLFGICE